MYVPSQFAVTNPAILAEVIGQFPFATLVTHDGQAPFATHLPVLFRPDQGPQGTIRAHLARANPQWRHFEDGSEALVVFQGPHAYVSPSWYRAQLAVPTWNYVVVHAYGRPRLIEDQAEFSQLLRDTTAQFESGRPNPWTADLPADYWHRMQNAIVGFEIPIARIEGKFKLSQNRQADDVTGVITALAASKDQSERETADWMRRFNPA